MIDDLRSPGAPPVEAVRFRRYRDLGSLPVSACGPSAGKPADQKSPRRKKATNIDAYV